MVVLRLAVLTAFMIAQLIRTSEEHKRLTPGKAEGTKHAQDDKTEVTELGLAGVAGRIAVIGFRGSSSNLRLGPQ